MVIHIHQGKGSKDRDVPLSPKLPETLREYWRQLKPKGYLFPGRNDNEHLTTKAVWHACHRAVQRPGIQKKISPHSLRHSYAMHLMKSGADRLSSAPKIVNKLSWRRRAVGATRPGHMVIAYA